MPVSTMMIQTDWNAWILTAGAAAAVPQHIQLNQAGDSGKTQVYLNFNYRGEDLHVSMALQDGGVTSSFHITPERGSNLIISSGKSGGKKTVKSTPSLYYDFLIKSTSVEFDSTEWTHYAGQDKTKVYNGKATNTNLVSEVLTFMEAFLLYMVAQGHGKTG